MKWRRAISLWPLVVFVATIWLERCYVHPGGPWTRGEYPAQMSRDEGTVLYDAVRIHDGQTMYRDFFEFQGPVFYYAHASLYAFTGRSWEASRALHVVTQAAASMLLAMILAALLRGWAGIAAGFGAALAHSTMFVPLWPNAYPHWMAEALLLGSIVVLLGPRTRWRLAIAGGLAALAVWTIQSLGVPALAAATIAVAIPSLTARRWRDAALAAGWLAGGAAAVTLVIFAFFAAHGALGAMLRDMFVWTSRYYAAGQRDATTYAAYTSQFLDDHAALSARARLLGDFGLQLTRYLPYSIFACAAVLGALGAWRAWKRQPIDVAAGGVAFAVLAPLFLHMVRADLTHVAFVASFGFVAAAATLQPFAHKAWVRYPAGALLLAAGVATWASYHDKARAIAIYDVPKNFHDEAFQNPVTHHFLDAPVGSKIAADGLYCFYTRDSGISFTYIAEFEDYWSDDQWRQLADELVTRKPAMARLTDAQVVQVERFRPEFAILYEEGEEAFRLRPDP